MRAASLCAGIGGLDLILESFGHEIAWHAEYDTAPSQVLAHHWPGVPNIGDITTANWADCEPVDIITAGYPCQPFSAAGLRKGTDDDRHLWPFVRDAIAHLRPRFALLENVRGHLTLGFDIVLADLAALGFDAEWGVLGSSDVGGCHRRQRLWVLATDTRCSRGWEVPRGAHGDEGSHGEPLLNHVARRAGAGKLPAAAEVALLPTPAAARASWDTALQCSGDGRTEPNKLGWAVALLPTPTCDDASNVTRTSGAFQSITRTIRELDEAGTNFGKYQAAVDRWASIVGFPPAPTDDKGRLNPPFVEWMMGYPTGWVTGLGLTRTAQLKALGNAVQPQAGAAAYSALACRVAPIEAAA